MNKKNSELTYREIYLQPQSFEAVNRSLDTILGVLDQVFADTYDELIFTGCGTSLYLAQAAAHAFSTCNKIPAKAVCCSELYYFPQAFVEGRRVLVLPVTRKSYTTEVRMAVDRVRAYKGVKTLAITCDPDSAAYNDYMILSPDTGEESVIMTRSFTSMVYMTVIMALHAGGYKDKIAAMTNYPLHAQDMLKKLDDLARRIVTEHGELDLYVILGQGVYYGVANECMNKIKEMGISNSEAYYSLEYRHGPMSLADEHTLIVMLGHTETKEEDIRLLKEMKEFGAVTVMVGGRETEYADYCMELPYGYDDLQNAALIGFTGQLLGYYIAESKGIDADFPRHLSQAIVIK